MMRLLLSIALLCSQSWAATYYMATTGNDAASGTIGAPWQTLQFSTTNIAAGDTLYIRGGVYTGADNMTTIQPPNGKSSTTLRTTVAGYPGELPVFENPAQIVFTYTIFDCRNLTNWTFSGLMWSNVPRSMLLQDCRYCIVTNCVQTKMTTNDNWYAGINCWGASQFNRFEGNTFTNWGHLSSPVDLASPCNIKGTHLYLGNGLVDDQTWYNLVQSNVFGGGAHDLLQVDGGYNVVRGNYFHNEPWLPTNFWCQTIELGAEFNMYALYGGRSMKPGDGDIGPSLQVDQRNVIEDNIFAYSGPPGDGTRAAMFLELGFQFGIVRRNLMMFNIAGGVYFSSAGAAARVRTNMVYNNTFYDNGLSSVLGGSDFAAFRYDFTQQSTVQSSNVLVNNLHWGNTRGPYDPDIGTWQIVRTNWTNGVYPSFASTNGIPVDTIPHYISSAQARLLPDLHLLSNSPCIDVGTFLARAVAAGSGTTLVVDNSLYFSDGNRIVTGDTIQFQGQTNTSTVISNWWEGNTLYLSTPLTWVNGQGVTLAYRGTAPDMGAFEFDNGNNPLRTIRAVRARVSRIK